MILSFQCFNSKVMRPQNSVHIQIIHKKQLQISVGTSILLGTLSNSFQVYFASLGTLVQ